MCFHIFVQFLVICDNDCKILQLFSKLYVFFLPYYCNVILFKSHFNMFLSRIIG